MAVRILSVGVLWPQRLPHCGLGGTWSLGQGFYFTVHKPSPPPPDHCNLQETFTAGSGDRCLPTLSGTCRACQRDLRTP